MKKYLFILIIIVFIVFSMNLIINARQFEINNDDIDIDTNIVLLSFYSEDSMIKSDYFFEILVFEQEDYILIPLNLLSSQTDLEIIFDRLNNTLRIKNPVNEKEALVNLKNREYINYPEWDDNPPVILNNDFYVSKKLISYLLEAEIEWKPRNQELALTGDFEQEKEEQDEIVEEEKEKIVKESKDKIVTPEGVFTLGSINYRLTLDYSDSNLYADNLEFKEVLGIFGRAGNWALSLKERGSYDINNNQTDLQIPYVKAEYKDESKLIIIGDSFMNFDNTIKEKQFRGLYFRTPDRLSVKVVPLIDISGQTEVESEVQLYINNVIRDEMIVDEMGVYRFEDVALSMQILNEIEIVITKPDDSTEVINKKLTVVEKLLRKGTKEFEAVAGLYKEESTISAYDGEILGFSGRIAVNEDLSLNTEASYFNKKYLAEEGEYLSSNIGLAYRLIDNAIVSLDWYYGDYEGLKEEGYKLNLHYALKKGFFDGYYLHIPQNLSELIPEEEGIEKRIVGVYNINDRWSIEPTIGVYESLNIEAPYQTEFVKLRLRRKNGWENYLALMGSYEKINRNYTFTVNEESFDIPGENQRIGYGLGYQKYQRGFKFLSEANVYENNINLPQEVNFKYKDIDYNLEVYKVLTDNLLINGSTSAEFEDDEGEISNLDQEAELRFRYNLFNNTFITLLGRYSSIETENIYDTRYTASVNSYLTDNINVFAQYSIIDTLGVFNYNEARIDSNYALENNSGYINLFARYVMPNDSAYEDRLSFGASYSKLFDNKNELEVEIGKNYESFVDENFEYYFRVSFAQAFAFAKDNILKTNYNSNDHRSFVAGYVYLDENNNGVYDEGEQPVPDITMRLDNLRAVSNEDGLYRFNPMFTDVYLLNFDYNRLFADYTPITGEKIIKIEDNQNLFLNFGLTLNGSISGKLFLDKNNNGIQDEEDEPLSWIGVTLDGKKYDYTDSRGEFYFENVSLGSHEINIVQESIPANLEYEKTISRNIIITKDKLDVQDIIIPLYYSF